MPLSTHIIKAGNIPDAWFQLIYDIFDDERALADIRRVDKGSFEGTLRREYKSILFEIANPCDPDLSKRIVRIPESKLGIPNPIDPIIYPEFKCPKCGERVTSFKPEQELYQIKPCDHYVSKEDYELNKPTMESAVVKYYGDYLFGSSLSKNEQYTYGSRIMESIRIDYDTRNPIVRELLNRFKKNIIISPSKIYIDVPQYYYLCAYILTNPQSNQIVMQIAKPSDLSLPDPPCITADAYITTSKGIRNADEIKVGDYILTHKGRFRRVEKVFEREHEDELYNVKRSGGLPLDITKLHPVLGLKAKKCYDDMLICKENCKKNDYQYKKKGLTCKSFFKDYQEEWINIENCIQDVYSPIQQEYIKDKINCKNTFSNSAVIKLKGLFKLFGYFLGDGSLLKPDVKDEGIKISLNIKDSEKIKEVQALFKDILNKETTCMQVENCMEVYCYSKNICRAFRRIFFEVPKEYITGKGGGKYTCRYKVFPVKFLYYPIEIQKELISGLMASDGYYRKNGDYCELYITSDKLIVLLSLMFANTYPRYTGSKRYMNKNISNIKGREIKSTQDGFVFSFREGGREYKQARYLEHRDKTYRPLNVEKYNIIKKVKVYNYEVEEDNSYIVNGWLPAHNCLRHADIRVRDGRIHWFINYRCLVGDTPVFAKVDDIILRSNMENLYEQHLNGSNIQVMSVDDKFEPMWGDVTNIQRQIKNDIIRIELFGGGGLSVTEDHRIFVLRGELKLLMEARDIEPGDFLLEPRSFSNVVEYTSDYMDLFQLFKDRGNVYVKDLTLDDFAIFKRNGVEYTENFRDKRYISVSSVQDSHLKELNNLTLGCQKQIFPRMYQLSEDFLYFMGLWLADGWYNSKGNALRLAISNKKDYNLNRVLKFLEEEFQYCPNTEDRDGCKVLNIAIKFLAMLFQDLGFVHGSKVKFVPNFVYTLDFVKLQIFLDGWLSGDGGTTTSKDMIVDFSYIMKRLGKNYSIYTEKSRRVFFRSENRIIESSGCHHIMEFGKDKSKRVENQHFYKKKVKSVGIISKEDFVYDLSVDTPSHLFFAGEVPVLVHNSWDMYSGMPLNLAGLSMLMDQMCVDTDLEPGSFICHSKGLHIYEHSWSSALARLGR